MKKVDGINILSHEGSCICNHGTLIFLPRICNQKQIKLVWRPVAKLCPWDLLLVTAKQGLTRNQAWSLKTYPHQWEIIDEAYKRLIKMWRLGYSFLWPYLEIGISPFQLAVIYLLARTWSCGLGLCFLKRHFQALLGSKQLKIKFNYYCEKKFVYLYMDQPQSQHRWPSWWVHE